MLNKPKKKGFPISQLSRNPHEQQLNQKGQNAIKSLSLSFGIIFFLDHFGSDNQPLYTPS